MDIEALTLFAFVSSITPGPNNLMLWASGMNFGLLATRRHIAGVNLGFASLLLAVALGLGALFQRWPGLAHALRLVGSVYLVYLAWRIAMAGRSDRSDVDRPMTFWEAAAFQYVNPKAWVMGITAAGAFIPTTMPPLRGAGSLAVIFALINLPCIVLWAAAGTGLGRIMIDERARRATNAVLATLLLATVYLINS